MQNTAVLSFVLVAFAHSAVCLETSYVENIAKILSNVELPQDEDLCSKQVKLMLQDVKNISISSWGFRMIDSWSRFPPSGLLSLNFGELGMFDQCIGIDAKAAGSRVRGKYCYGTIGIGSTSTSSQTVIDFIYNDTQIRRQHILRQSQDDNPSTTVGFPLALCLPNSCSRAAIQAISDAVFAELLGSAIGVTYNSCQDIYDANPELTTGAILTISFFALLTAVMLLSSVYDYHCQNRKMPPKSLLLVAFSVYTNFQKLFKISTSAADLSCLNGIRVLCMFWVILGHVTLGYTSAPSDNMADFFKWIDQWHSMFIVSGTLAVDTFFVVGGLLVVYVFMKAVHNKVKFNIFLFYLHRYLRLTPVLAAVTLVNATVLNYFGSGPVWYLLSLTRKNVCREGWWGTILYIQNYVNPEEFCIGESWYLNVDMQIYVFSPIFLYALTRSKRIGSALLGLMIIVFMVVPFCVTWINELPGLMVNFNGNAVDFQLKYYLKTHARAAPWFIGALVGFFISEIKFEGKKIKINKVLNNAIWLIVFVLMFALVLVGHDTLRGVEYDKWGNALYNTFIRPTWGLCVAWVIFACVTGHGGFVNRILSLSIFQVMNRFIYSMYLIHASLIYIIAYSQKTGLYFSLFSVFYTFWGTFMFSFMVSIFWVLAFESPIIIIEKVLLGKHR